MLLYTNVVSAITNPADMPYTSDGEIPDIIVTPQGIPTRIGSRLPPPAPPLVRAARAQVGKGQMGSALMVSLQVSCFCDRDFWGIPVNLLLSPQKCQGVPFSPICQHSLLLQRPLRVDPICLQPSPRLVPTARARGLPLYY